MYTQVHRGNLEELVKAILAMPVPKKNDQKPIVTQKVEEPMKQTQKPVQQEQTDEDRIDFVNVKDIIKGMEKQKPEPRDYSKETNGFQKKITDNGHDYEKKLEDEDLQKTDEDEKTIRSDKSLEKTESSDSSESLSRSNSYVNGVPVQVPKPLPRSSISEAGSSDDQVSEAPKPKPRTTAIPVSGYKVFFYLSTVVDNASCKFKVFDVLYFTTIDFHCIYKIFLFVKMNVIAVV